MPITKASQNVITPNIVTTDTTQTISGTKTFSATIVGNAATSTKLLTARTINGKSFDGTANINIPSTKQFCHLFGDGVGGGIPRTNLTGTYSRLVGNPVVTLTFSTAHGFLPNSAGNGPTIFCDFTTGTAVDGWYNTTIIDSLTLSIVTLVTTATTGNFQTGIIPNGNWSTTTFASVGFYLQPTSHPTINGIYCINTYYDLDSAVSGIDFQNFPQYFVEGTGALNVMAFSNYTDNQYIASGNGKIIRCVTDAAVANAPSQLVYSLIA